MTVTPRADARRERLLSPAYAVTTVGMFALVALVAFEATAVTTVMPTVARELDAVSLYALAFAAPLASGVVGMVAAGSWADRRGPAAPLAASLVLFTIGLLVCGTAPTMPLLLAGRVLQGLGGGAITVGLYVMVGLVFPAALRPAVFATFAAAWVLPTLFGPALAGLVAQTVGWRWVFLGATVLVAAAAALVVSALRRAPASGSTEVPVAWRRLSWAVAAAAAVLVLELAGGGTGARVLLALLPLAVVVVSLRRLLPPGTLVAARGLPAVIGTRGLLSAGFFCAEAYVVFVLEERWGLSATTAGLALSGVGISWAVASQVQARLGDRIAHTTAIRVASALVLVGTTGVLVVVATHAHPLLAGAAYVVAGAGMGFGYSRTSVATLEVSGDTDRGAHTSALTVADSLGAALALSVSGVVFGLSERVGVDRFVAVYGLAVAIAVVGVVVASRTPAAGPRHGE